MMDTSKLYIKMCDCDEIQGQRPKGNEFSISYKNPDIWIEHEGNFLYAKHDVWLPRQDKIQEMCLELPQMKGRILKPKWEMYYDFFDFWADQEECPYKNKKILESMEQLWLAFYMHEKHKKIWNGEKWVGK